MASASGMPACSKVAIWRVNTATSRGLTRSKSPLMSTSRLSPFAPEPPAPSARFACRPPTTSRTSLMKMFSLRSAWRRALGPSDSRVPAAVLPAAVSPFQA